MYKRQVHGLRLQAGPEAPAGAGDGSAEPEPLRLMLGERLLAIARPREGELVTEVVLA